MKHLLAAVLLMLSAPAVASGPCGGYFTSAWTPQPNVPVGVVIQPPVSGGGGDGGGAVHGGDFGGMSDAKALLIVAVVAVAALPLFLYALDENAAEDVLHCWGVPTETFNLYGGAVGGGGLTAGFMGVRGAIGFGLLGMEASVETSPRSFHDIAGALALRAPPRQHVELSLAVGVRQLADRFAERTWFELALPHRYLPFRIDAYRPGVSFEFRPALLWATNALDVRVDASVVVPFSRWATAAFGLRVYSFGPSVRGGPVLGLNLNL